MTKGNKAVVISASRRHLKVVIDNNFYSLIIERKYSNLLAGDIIYLDDDHTKILSVTDRKNLLKRTFKTRTKEIAANTDELWIVSAPPPLLNILILDKILCLAIIEGIKPVLVFNKNDLGYDSAQSVVDYYKKIGIDIDFVTAKDTKKIDPIINRLDKDEHFQVVLCGVSGVGKSTLLQKLVPEVEIRTTSVSEKTGQGRQTTSSVNGYIYNRDNKKETFLFDLPGIQNFGITHFDKYQIKSAFIEYDLYSHECDYKDCLHLEEPVCGVKEAIKRGDIIQSRYTSYLQIFNEIDQSKPY